jgi:hypothetical protein
VQRNLSLCLAKSLAVWFRYNIGELATISIGELATISLGELATISLGESEVFCFLADEAELAGDEPKSDGVPLFGVSGRDDPLEL